MSQIKLKTSERKAQITDAALHAIAQKGLRGLTVSAIARKIGMSDSNIYRHYKNKNDVIYAIITEIDMNLRQIRKDALAKEKDPVRRLKYIFKNHLNFLELHKGIPKIIFSDDIYSTNKELSEKMKSTILNHVKVIKDILMQGKKRGTLRRDLDIDTAAAAFIGHIQSTALQRVLFKHLFPLKITGDKLWNIYLEGIINHPKHNLHQE